MKTIDTSHPAFNIPPKKKRPKSTWCNGFIVKNVPLDDLALSRLEFSRQFNSTKGNVAKKLYRE